MRLKKDHGLYGVILYILIQVITFALIRFFAFGYKGAGLMSTNLFWQYIYIIPIAIILWKLKLKETSKFLLISSIVIGLLGPVIIGLFL